MTQSAAMPGPTTRVNADRRKGQGDRRRTVADLRSSLVGQQILEVERDEFRCQRRFRSGTATLVNPSEALPKGWRRVEERLGADHGV